MSAPQPPKEALDQRAAPVEVAMLDLQFQRAAAESLRRWRKRPLSARRQRVYDEAARRLTPAPPSPAQVVELSRLLVALEPPRESA